MPAMAAALGALSSLRIREPCWRWSSTSVSNLRLSNSSHFAQLQNLFRSGGRKQVHGPGDDAGPTRLMARTEARSVITVEVFVKQDVIAPVRIFLEFLRSTIDWPPTIRASKKDAGQPSGDLLGHLVQSHAASRTGRTFDGKFIAIVGVILQQGSYDQGIHGHPDRATPV